MARTRTKTTSKGSAAASLLGSIGKKTPGKSKSATPQITVSDEASLEVMLEIIDAKNAVKQAESTLKIAEGAFRDDATDLFEKRCRDDGTLHTSVRFMGRFSPDGEDARPLSLQYVQPRRCKKMQEDDASDPLHSAFGADFDALFVPQRTIEIDTSKLTDEQIGAVVEAMQEALGDSFDDAVAVQALIVPKPGFFDRRILDAKIRAKADNAAADGYAIPFISSFKL